jgi:hypothetical protein
MDSRIISLWFYCLPAPPQDHEPFISSTLSLPICEPTFISPTSYRNSPMGPPPFISFPRQFCPPWGPHFTPGNPFLYLYFFSPKLFIIYCTNTFISSPYILCRHRWRLAFFWPHATHVTLGWSITYHSPLSASSISSENSPSRLPLPSEFFHLVPPLAQLSTGLVVPLTLDLVTRLRPLFFSYIL